MIASGSIKTGLEGTPAALHLFLYLLPFSGFHMCLTSFLIISVFAQKKSNQEISKTLDDYLTRMEGFGFSGAVIVEKDNVLLIYPKDKEQDIKQIQKRIKAKYGD